MTARSFCQWVDQDLLPNVVLEPGFPGKISIETVRKWLHHLEFHVLDPKKGIYINGHEREDVVAYRAKFLRKMVGIGFINKNNAPTAKASQCLPDDLQCPPQAILDKTVVIFHDESIFTTNKDQQTQWGNEDIHVIKSKGKLRVQV